jgi:hypothetical protein
MNNKEYRNSVKLSATAARRLIRVGRHVEQQPRSTPPQLAGPTDFGGAVMLLVTTALNPMSGATPGQNGRGKIQKFDGTTYSDLSSTVYPIHNDTEKTVAVGAYLLAVPAYGFWHWIQADKCSRLS